MSMPTLRILCRHAGFSLAVVGVSVAALGSAVISLAVIDGLLWRPLPYADADRLGVLRARSARTGSEGSLIAFPAFRALAEFPTTAWRVAFSEGTETDSLPGGPAARMVRLLRVSRHYFETLGVQPIRGRLFLPSEFVPGSNVALVTDELWRGVLDRGASPGGRLLVGRRTLEIVGVLPPRLKWPTLADAPDIVLPLVLDEPGVIRRRVGPVLVRTAGGLGEAEAGMNAVVERATLGPDFADETLHLVPLRAELFRRGEAIGLAAAVGVAGVLLLAWTNVTLLLLAHVTRLEPELAIRCALGAGRTRLLWSIWAQMATLLLVASAAALLLAGAGLRAVRARMAEVAWWDLGIDLRVLTVTLVLAAGTSAVVIVVPALRLLRANLAQRLACLGGGSGSSAATSRWGRALVAVQIAASGLLVAVALGATSSLHRLLSVDLGFRPEHVLAFQVGLDNVRYPQHPQRLALVERIVERVHRLGAVVEAGAVDHLPLVDSAARLMRGHGRTLADSTLIYAATPGFFQAFGVPLVAGRALTWDDVRRQEKVALVSEACARRLWCSRDPLGEHLPAGSGLEGHQVIGVTRDIRRSYGEPLVPTVFVPFNGGWSSQAVTIVVKVQKNGQRAALAVERDIRALVPDSYVSGSWVRDRLDRAVDRPKAAAAGMSVLAGLSAVLAAAGSLGLIGHEAARRRVEIAVRVALGAGVGRVWWAVMAPLVGPVMLALCGGIGGAYVATSLGRSTLEAFGTVDVRTAASACVLVVAIVVATSGAVVWRAWRARPADLLRAG